MLDPHATRAMVKRWVGWDSPRPGRFKAWAREYFQRDVDAAARYGPAMEPARRARRVLEVGSGPMGIAPFVGRRVVGVDRSFAGSRTSRLVPVMADGLALPFAADTFDLVICFDVVEHVPAAARPALVAELARVSSGRLLLAAPCGAPARDADRAADALCRDRRGQPHRWLVEHLEHGIPERAELADLGATTGGRLLRSAPYTALWLWWLARREELLFRPHLTLLRRFILPPFRSVLWRLPGANYYRWLIDIDLGTPGAPLEGVHA